MSNNSASGVMSLQKTVKQLRFEAGIRRIKVSEKKNNKISPKDWESLLTGCDLTDLSILSEHPATLSNYRCFKTFFDPCESFYNISNTNEANTKKYMIYYNVLAASFYRNGWLCN